MEDIDDFHRLAAYTIQNTIGCFDQLANTRPPVPVNHPAKLWERRQMITALEDLIDRIIRGLLRVGRNVAMDIGERSQRPV